MDLQKETNRDFLPNKQILIELLTNDENGSIPLVNFLDNTQYFFEKIKSLELKVQELEQKIEQNTFENSDISTMQKIEIEVLPKNVEKIENIHVLDSHNNEDHEKCENVQEPQINVDNVNNVDNIDVMLMTNLEHMENLVQIVKKLHST